MASVDKPEDNKRFAEENNADYPILSDPTKETATAYGALSPRGFASRWTFYIDKDGIIQKIDREVSAGSAGEDTVKNLEALGFPKKSAE